eukprot:CAMPEP_0114532278 /NCGR_PEP_ID=MMETSP0109-20121206/26575_1 /TAXON_ID=29199 /ORGANISM="Chlorarachnion reptans, Strain CCCM449" /LENGTH=268 /DNA_ID=CAMNT_0001715321 /DNA_START=450 /DNA_END=1257 /DNA_ORIENTATION=+
MKIGAADLSNIRHAAPLMLSSWPMPYSGSKPSEQDSSKGSLLAVIRSTNCSAFSDRVEVDEEAEEKDKTLRTLVRKIRFIRGKNNIPARQSINAEIRVSSPDVMKHLLGENQVLLDLASINPKGISFSLKHSNISKVAEAKKSRIVIQDGLEVLVPLEDLFDIEKESARLEKQKLRLKEEIATLQARLRDNMFVTRARPAQVNATRVKCQSKEIELQQVERGLEDLNTNFASTQGNNTELMANSVFLACGRELYAAIQWGEGLIVQST